MTCKDCIHYEPCFEYGNILDPLGGGVKCDSFKNKADFVEVVRCKDCKHGRAIDKNKLPEKYFRPDCVVCECEDVVFDDPTVYLPTHFCSYGERKNDFKE